MEQKSAYMEAKGKPEGSQREARGKSEGNAAESADGWLTLLCAPQIIVLGEAECQEISIVVIGEPRH